MNVVKLINCIKRKEDCEKYFQQLRSLKSCDFANVTLNKIILNLRVIIDYEFQNDCNHDSEKISNVIYEGILNSSSTVEAWSKESKPVAVLLKHWFNLCNELQKHNFDKCWKHFAKVLCFIEESCSKHQSISELVLLHLTGDLLELVIAPGLPWSAVNRILKTLTCCAGYSSRQLRAQLSANFQTHFVQLAHLLVECGDEVGQSFLLETLLRFLKLRSDRNSRIRAAQLWFPQTDDWKQAINFFHNSNFNRFDTDCRSFLNAVNQVTQLVTSVACHAAYVGDLQLRNVEDDPSDLFWVDFNHGPCTLSVSSDAQCLLQAGVSSTEVWETITVDRQIVTAVELVRSEAVAEMRMSLHSPPEYVSVLSRTSIQTHGHSVRVQFQLDPDLHRVNRALADIFAGIFKKVDNSTLELWISGLNNKKCSVIVKRSSTLLYRAKRPRLSDSSDDVDTVVVKTGPLLYSPHTMQPPQLAVQGRGAITSKGKVSRAVRRAANNNVCATPAMSVASSTSTNELAQLPEKLRQYDSVVYTKELESLAQSPALTNITEETSSALHSVAPSLHSLSTHCTHMPGVFRNNITYRQNDRRTYQKSILYQENDISLLDKTFEDDKRCLASQKCDSNDMIVENILREAFMKENTICEKIKIPIVVSTRLDAKLIPQTISSNKSSSPKSQLSNVNKLSKNTKKQNPSSDEFPPEKMTLIPNMSKRAKILHPNPEKLQSQLSAAITVLKPFKPNIQLSASEEIQTQLSQPRKLDGHITNKDVTVEQSSELDDSTSQPSKPDKPQKLSCESYKNSDSGIMVTGVSNSQHNSLLTKNMDHKEYASDVSVILNTPEILPQSVGSKQSLEKSFTKKSASRNKQKKILKSRKKYVAHTSDNENNIPEPTLQKKPKSVLNSVSNCREVDNKKETIDSGGSFQKLNEIDVDNFFNQNESNTYLQTSENADIARRNNLSSPDTDKSESNFALNPLTTPRNVYAEDMNIDAPSPTHFVIVAEESNDDSNKNMESHTSRGLESGKTGQPQIDIKNSARSSSIDCNLNTPYNGEKKRRKLYSPKDAITSFQFENPQNDDEDVGELIADNQVSIGRKLKHDRRFNYTSTTSFDDIDKVTEGQGERVRSRIRNKKLFAQSNTTNYTSKQPTKELNKTSESSVQENNSVYTFSEDSKSSYNRQHRNKRFVKKDLESTNFKKRQIRLKSSNKRLIHSEDTDSTDDFKPSKVTPIKRLFVQSIGRVKKVVDESKDDYLQDERMREAQAHSDSLNLNHSLLDSDDGSPQENCPEATLKRPHRVLQMETNHYENKVDDINIQIDAESNNRDVQTKHRVEVLSEKSVSSSDEFLIKKARKKNVKYTNKKPSKNYTSNKLIDTSNDTLPSLIIESEKRVDVDGDINKVFEALQDKQVDLKTASLNHNKITINPELEIEYIIDKTRLSSNDAEITECCDSENRDRVPINPSAEELNIEYILDKTGLSSNDAKITEFCDSENRDRVPINPSAEELEIEYILDKTRLSSNDAINTECCDSENPDRVTTMPSAQHLEIKFIIDKTRPGSNDAKRDNTDVCSKEQEHLEDKNISSQENTVINLLEDVSETVILVEDVSETINSNRNYDCLETNESINQKLISFDTVGMSPIRAHRYYSEDIAPSVHSLDRPVSPRVWEDDEKAEGTPPDELIPRDKDLMHEENYFLENTPTKTDGRPHLKIQMDNVSVIRDHISSPLRNENTKGNKPVKESQQSIVTCSGKPTEKLKKNLITGSKNHSEVVQRSILTHGTKKPGFTTTLDVPQQDIENQSGKNIEESQKLNDSMKDFKLSKTISARCRTNWKASQEVIVVGNNNNLGIYQQNVIQNKNILKRAQPDLFALGRNQTSAEELKTDSKKHTAIQSSPPCLNKEPNSKDQQQETYVNIMELNNNVQKVLNSSPCSESSSLLYDLLKMTEHISPVPETLSPSIENVKITEFYNNVQKSQNLHTKIPSTPPRLKKETILKNQHETFGIDKIENIKNTKELNNNVHFFYDSSPCSQSPGLFYDRSKMTQISPIPETLSPPIAQMFLKLNTHVVEVETENDSVAKQKSEGNNTMDASSKPLRPTCTEDSTQNVDSLSQNSVDTEIKSLAAYVSQKAFSPGKAKRFYGTELSQSLTTKDPALRNPNSSTSGHSSNLSSFPVLSKVVIRENCNGDSLGDDVSYCKSVEKPVSSNANSTYVTNWLNNIPEQNNDKKSPTLEQCLETIKQLMETFENKFKENEEESKRRWRTVYTAFHENLLEWTDQLDLLRNQLQKCCEKKNALQHTWKHTVVKNLREDVEVRNAAVTSMRDIISQILSAITNIIQHENDDNSD